MKKTFILTILALITVLSLRAQAPRQFKYQSILRDANGTMIANAAKAVKIEIVQGSVDGVSVFTEEHGVTTSSQGLINLNIGSVNQTGIEDIDWALGPYFIRITVDGVEMGTSQLLSVPYALYPEKA